MSSSSSPPSSGALALSPSATSTASATASTGETVVPSRGRVDCQYPGCLTRAKYGPKDAPPTACQAHKRAGQYTINRHGEMLIATRDGDAFRTPAVAAPVSPAPSSGTAVLDVPRGPSEGGNEKTCSSAGKQAAQTSSSSVDGVKRASRPALSSGIVGGSPPSQPQNRPCLFPGCNSPPEYGLPGAARAVYCLSHKKGSMVLISKGALALQGNGDDLKKSATVTPSNKAINGKSHRKGSPAPAAAPASTKKARALITEDESKVKKARHVAKSTGVDYAACEDGGSQTEQTNSGKDSKGTMEAGTGLKHAVDDSTATVVTEITSSRKSVSGSFPPSRMGDVAGMAPSAEIFLVRQAREAAKKEAEAGGGGRRPRAPSRRALEASGRMTGTGAQWMTRERKAEEARVNAEMREQRKQYRAAGLKVGVVLEAFVAGAGVTGANGNGGGSGVHVGGGGGAGEEGGEAEIPYVDAGWRKVPPAVFSAPPLQPISDHREMSSAATMEMGEKRTTPTAAANSA